MGVLVWVNLFALVGLVAALLIEVVILFRARDDRDIENLNQLAQELSNLRRQLLGLDPADGRQLELPFSQRAVSVASTSR